MFKSGLSPLLLSLFLTAAAHPAYSQDAFEVPAGNNVTQGGPGKSSVISILKIVARAEESANSARGSAAVDNLDSRQSGAKEEMDAAVHDAERKLIAMGSSIAPVLLDNMNDRHQQVNNLCVRVLSRFGKDSVAAIIKRVQENQNNNQSFNYNYYYAHQREAQILQQIGSESFPGLNQALKSESADERAAAAMLLFEMAQYISPSNEESLVIPLSTIDALCELLNHDASSRVREFAATALGRIGPRNGKVMVSVSTALSADSDPKVRRKCAQALGTIAQRQSEVPAHETAKALAQALAHDEYEGVRMTAATSLGQAKTAVDLAVPALTQALQDPVLDVKNAALNSLCNFGSSASAAVPVLLRDLNSTNVRDAQTAIRLLAQIGPPAAPAVPALLKIARDIKPNEQYLRYSVVQALAGIGPKALPAVPYLIEMLHSQDYSLQREAVHALGAIGPSAHPAESALRELIEREPRLKTEAEQALNLIKKGGSQRNLIET